MQDLESLYQTRVGIEYSLRMEDFYTVLKKKRKELFTQQQFAAELGISDTMVQNYETDTLPPHAQLLKINKLLSYDFSRHIYQEQFGTGPNPVQGIVSDLKLIIEKYTLNSETHSPPPNSPVGKGERKSMGEFLPGGKLKARDHLRKPGNKGSKGNQNKETE